MLKPPTPKQPTNSLVSATLLLLLLLLLLYFILLLFFYQPNFKASSAMNPMSSASEMTEKELTLNGQLQVSQENVSAHHESEGVSTELKLGYGSCITTERELSENLVSFSLSETARAVKRMKLEEGEGPNGVSLELKVGLFDPWVIRKRITFSDINVVKSRLLLPKYLVEKHILRQWEASIENIKNNGVRVAVWDCDTDCEHQLLFKQWGNGSPVLFGNWIMGFVRRRDLKEGDEIGLYWDQSSSRFSFCLLKQASSN